jgi:glycosyltransferase involved in cell wall biosynthesis
MISFIIIGKNIEYTIENCIRSVKSFINENKLSDSEIIYVDSDSTDRSVTIATAQNVNVIICKGQVNAAVGRNEGAKFSKQNILFFIDGDMEIIPSFFPVAFNSDASLKYPFCSGDFINVFYDGQHKFLNEQSYDTGQALEKDIFINATGGLFIIEKKYYLELNGMDERLKRNQDLDFGIRMAKLKLPLLKYRQTLAYHHTIKYTNSTRLLSITSSKFLMYYGILIRKHILSKMFIWSMVREKYSVGLFLASFFNIYIFIFYLLIQVGRSVKNYKREKAILNSIIYKITSDAYCLLGFLFFYPKQPKYQLQTIPKSDSK